MTDVSPLALADDIGVDPLRYHLLREVPLGADGDFSYEGIVARYNADLANNLGNLVSRVTTVVRSKCGGVGPACDPGSALAPVAAAVLDTATAAWARWAPHEALEATWRLIGAANAELEAPSPGRWTRDPRSTRSSATRSRCCASWRSWSPPPCRRRPPRSGAGSGSGATPPTPACPTAPAGAATPAGPRSMKGDPLFPRRKG